MHEINGRRRTRINAPGSGCFDYGRHCLCNRQIERERIILYFPQRKAPVSQHAFIAKQFHVRRLFCCADMQKALADGESGGRFDYHKSMELTELIKLSR